MIPELPQRVMRILTTISLSLRVRETPIDLIISCVTFLIPTAVPTSLLFVRVIGN